MANFPGTPNDDAISGTSGDDTLRGEGGNDTLTGGAGVDALRGGPGDDTYILRPGDGTPPGAIPGINPREEIFERLGEGTDILRIVGVDPADLRIWSASTGVVTFGIDDGTGRYLETDVFTGASSNQPFWDLIEIIEFDGGIRWTSDMAQPWIGLDIGQVTTGTQLSDRLEGRGGDDTLNGGSGNDTIVGGAGADNMTGGDGDDLYIIGANDGGLSDFSIDIVQEQAGGGTDTIRFAALDAGTLRVFQDSRQGLIGFVGANAADPRQATYVDHGITSGSPDLWDQIERIVLSDGTVMTEATGLSATGLDTGGLLLGTRADDRLDGRGGDDFINGSTGNDLLIGGTGNDTLIGGEGTDTVRIGADSASIQVTATAEDFILTHGGEADTVDDTVEVIAFDDVTLAFSDLASLVQRVLTGTDDAERLTGGAGSDSLSGLGGNDTLEGAGGNDTLLGGDGSDRLIGGAGNDSIEGGATSADLRDVVFGGDGDDTIDGGHGNDELRGDAGNDEIAGGFGADTVIGGEGNDTLTGSAFGDLMFGGDGMDFVNGGFGSDRVNGGAGADRFFHLGIGDHGNDWIQDYGADDVLVYGGAASATADQFQVNRANTANAGDASVDEAFVIYKPTGQILWALVDGFDGDGITLRLASGDVDLLA